MDKNKEEGLRALSLQSVLMGLSVGFYSSAQEEETSRNKKTRTLCLLKSETDFLFFVSADTFVQILTSLLNDLSWW